MKLLVIGSGGREHTLIWKFKQSPKVTEIFAAPGNAGIAALATCVDIAVDDIEGLVAFAKTNAIDLTVVGPELPLVLGVVDAFEAAGLKIFGPNKSAARFEGSKDFTKAFLMRHGIPTAKYASFTAPEAAIAALPEFGYPVVVKADGLAAGKGVIIAQDEAEAQKAILDMMADKVFGAAGDLIVLESFLRGIEASILCFVDGKHIMPMQPAQDYKKIFDHDLGLNTGGMGTYSPSQIIDGALMSRIQEEILNPFITGIQKDGITFKGILFVGIMIDGDMINVLEYNVRMGDPETEVTLPRLENDLVEIIEAILDERLHEVELAWSDSHAVCVIMASGGYPEHYDKGFPITGLQNVDGAVVFHCGTKFDGEAIVTNGGRVLGVTALGETLEAAREAAYDNVKHVRFNEAFYRMDIAKRIERM
jgi:phosphoribosylamine--glycine ligase